jgi:glycosyltransferase involved in cell wall biosynthesis
MGSKILKRNDESMKISVVMMVKNEEKVLERCLKSVHPFADEIVLIDTGSTDRTMEIARKYGCQITEKPWENDFSAHRNQGIDRATGDWLFLIDADEKFVCDLSKKKLIKKIKKAERNNISALAVRMRDKNAGGHVRAEWDIHRFFRRGCIRYKNAVHNQPVIKGESAFLAGPFVEHYGYDLGEEKKLEKMKRSIPLMEKRIEDDPNDFDAMYFLSNYLISIGEFDDGIKWGEKVIAQGLTKENPIYHGLYHSVGSAYLRKGQGNKAVDSFYAGLLEDPENIDLHFDLAFCCRLSGQREQMLPHILTYFQLIEKQGPSGAFRLNVGEDKKNLAAKWARTKKILITGHARSGTAYTAKLLQACGLEIGHELTGMDGAVSWPHLATGKLSWLPGPVNDCKFDMIFHQVREPLACIASIMTESDEAFGYRFKHIGHPGGKKSLKWAMYSWLKWNELAEKKSIARFRVEDLPRALPEILIRAGYKPPVELPDIDKNTNSRDHAPLTWADLENEDKELAGLIKKKAREYGYKGD